MILHEYSLASAGPHAMDSYLNGPTTIVIRVAVSVYKKQNVARCAYRESNPGVISGETKQIYCTTELEMTMVSNTLYQIN